MVENPGKLRILAFSDVSFHRPCMAEKRPNVLFILSDDQGPWALGCAENSELRTPNLDRLARSGMRMDHFFCASPVCSPARATLLTGKIPSQHGVHDWIAGGSTLSPYESVSGEERIPYLQGQSGYPERLREAGYDTALCGKWHLGDSHQPQLGFEHWSVHAKGGGPYYGAPFVEGESVKKISEYVTDYITDQALDWLENRPRPENPFYLSVHYTAPHSPWGREQHPDKLYSEYYDNCPFHSVPKGLRPPEWAKGISIPVQDDATRREYLSGYYAAMTAMDLQIGRLLDWLEDQSLREETLIVFTSDNGMCMGHHGIFGKGNATDPVNMFEESIQVPFLISHPGIIPASSTYSGLLSQYDWMPTLLDYLGLPAEPGNLPGVSFASCLRGGERSAEGQSVVIFDEYGPVRMIRNREWKWIRRYPEGPQELYHLPSDPEEQNNLAEDATCAEMRERLDRQLEAWFSRYVSDSQKDGKNQTARGFGQIGLSGSPDSFLTKHPDR